MATARLSFKIRATGPDLFYSAQLDGKPFVARRAHADWLEFQHEFIDGPGQHVLEIAMAGKTPQHTRLDSEGNILEDCYIEIQDFMLQDFPIGYALMQNSYYIHDFNGTGDPTRMGFYGIMGCNGVVKFEFQGPTTLWLLENT
jgi:hypothetical protein